MRVGHVNLFLFFYVLSLRNVTRIRGSGSALVVQRSGVGRFVGRVGRTSGDVSFVGRPPALAPPILSSALQVPGFSFASHRRVPGVSPCAFSKGPFKRSCVSKHTCRVGDAKVLDNCRSFRKLPSVNRTHGTKIVCARHLGSFVAIAKKMCTTGCGMCKIHFGSLNTGKGLSFHVGSEVGVGVFNACSICGKCNVAPTSRLFVGRGSCKNALRFGVSSDFKVRTKTRERFGPVAHG